MFFKKIKLTHYCFKSLFVTAESTTWVLFIFWPSKIRVNPTGVVSSFPLLGAASPLTDLATALRHIALPFHGAKTSSLPPLPSHGAKTSSLPPLHLPAMLHPVVSPLEPKLKH
jgi:hypothetical protein